jgi:26S proteasome regulatory subunit N5
MLEQIRLSIAANDWVAANNIVHKISTKWFWSEDKEGDNTSTLKKVNLKLRYYDLRIQIALHQEDYTATAEHYLSVYKTPIIQENADQARIVMQNVLIFMVLAPYTEEQRLLSAQVVAEPRVKHDQMGWVGAFAKHFLGDELMRSSILQYILTIDGPLSSKFMDWSCGQPLFSLQLQMTLKVKRGGTHSLNASLNM